jgi:hypothetical protein
LALGTVWRWADATEPLAGAALASLSDDALWARLAMAYGSAGDPRRALAAALHGLALNPRDNDLLRVQSLALDRLDAPDGERAAARAALERFRPPDNAPAVKSACQKRFAWCALERLPVHLHRMRGAH